MHEDGLIPIDVTGPGHARRAAVAALPPPRLPRSRGRGRFPDARAGTSPPRLSPGTFVFMLDEYGVPVWYKRTPYPVVGVFPQANGDLAWRQWTPGIGGFPPLTPRDPDRDPQPRRQRRQHGQPARPRGGRLARLRHPAQRQPPRHRLPAAGPWPRAHPTQCRSRTRRIAPDPATRSSTARSSRSTPTATRPAGAGTPRTTRCPARRCCRSASTSTPGPGRTGRSTSPTSTPSTCSPTATCSSTSATSRR